MFEQQRHCFGSTLLALALLIRCCTDAATNELEIRYSIPRVTMKLIIVDDDVQTEQFKVEIDTITQLHLVNSFLDELPAGDAIVNRDRFRSVTLTSSIERVPVEIQENSTAVKLSVMRSEFTGFSNFSVSDDKVDVSVISREMINNTTDLRIYTLDAFRQQKGFWNFANLIKDNKFLAVTGKLQIIIDNLIVADADLDNDNPNSDDADKNSDADLSKLTIVIISVACIVVACIGGLGGLIWYLRHREFELEKKSQERREMSKQARMKGLGMSSSSFDHSMLSNDVAALRQLERKSSMTSLASLELKASPRGDAKPNQNDSDESLLDSIAKESTNLEYEGENQARNFGTRMNQHDDDESEFCSVQSASERSECVDTVRATGMDKNVIISQSNHRPVKRNSTIGTTPPILKPAIKNSHEGRQFVTDTTRKYISYNSSNSVMSSSFVNHSSPRSPQKFISKNKLKNLQVSAPVSSARRGSITSGKALLPATSPTSRVSVKRVTIGESMKPGKNEHFKNEAIDDGIMVQQMSTSSLSCDIMDCSNSDKASISPCKTKTTHGSDDRESESSLSFVFT